MEHIIYTIYKAVNNVNGKVYIGFDSRWPNRKIVHKSASKNQDGKFYRAIRKYGWNNFDWTILYQSKDRKHCLNEMETYFIEEHDSFNNGYNSTLGGDGSFGLKHTEETRKKISEKNKISKPQTKEHIEKRASKCRGKKLGPLSEETKLKISKATKGISKPMTEEHKNNLACHRNNVTKVSCPYCNKIGQLTNMKRWHFDNCKSIPKGVIVDTEKS
jgi:group I intron endonuclease